MTFFKRFYPLTQAARYIISYLIAFGGLIFITNILFRSFYYEIELPYVKAQIEHSSGYQINGNEYSPVNEDPQLYINYSQESVNKIRLELSSPLQADTAMQIYYPDAGKNYAEERSSFFTLPAGEMAVDLEIPKGEFGVLRLDINGYFKLSQILLTVKDKNLLYARTNYLWGCRCLCIFAAFLFCGILYQINPIRKLFRKWYDRLFANINAEKTRKKIVTILKWMGLSVVIGLLIEFAISALFGKPFNSKEFYIIIFITVFVLSLIKLRDFYKQKIEFAAMLVLFLSGIVFSFVQPVSAGVSWDDQIHYANTVQDARLGLNKNKIYAAESDFATRVPLTEYDRSLRKERDNNQNELYRSGETVTTPYNLQHSMQIKDLGYLPAIIGTWISWGLCLSFTGTIIFTRIINALFFSVMVYLSMKNVKSGKMLIAVFALVPTVFFLASSFSYDTWLTVLLIYGFSRYFRELQHREEPLTWGRFLGIFIPLFLALGPKVVYAPLLFLTAYMPKEKFKDRKWCYAYRACFVFAALVIVAGVCYIASGKYDLGIGDTRGGDTVNAMQQLAYIKTNFGEFCITLVNFLKEYFSYSRSTDYLTLMAYLGNINLPWIPITLLLFTAITDRISQDRKTIPIASKISAVFMYIVIGAICAVSMYIMFTPVGLGTINGCQGRYILPAMLPVLYMLTRFGGKVIVKQKIKAEYYNMALIGISVLFLMYNLWINCAVKY